MYFYAFNSVCLNNSTKATPSLSASPPPRSDSVQLFRCLYIEGIIINAFRGILGNSLYRNQRYCFLLLFLKKRKAYRLSQFT